MTIGTTSAGSRGLAHPGSLLSAGGAMLRHALGWPGRVYRARRLMAQLGGMDDRELRDIGLTRQDLRDATAFGIDADPSPLFQARAAGRRARG